MESGKPLVFAEKPMKTGKGDKAYKSLTAAVKAAEKARDEIKALKNELLLLCTEKTQNMHRVQMRAHESMRKLLVWNIAAAGVSLISFFLLVFI